MEATQYATLMERRRRKVAGMGAVASRRRQEPLLYVWNTNTRRKKNPLKTALNSLVRDLPKLAWCSRSAGTLCLPSLTA